MIVKKCEYPPVSACRSTQNPAIRSRSSSGRSKNQGRRFEPSPDQCAQTSGVHTIKHGSRFSSHLMSYWLSAKGKLFSTTASARPKLTLDGERAATADAKEIVSSSESSKASALVA